MSGRASPPARAGVGAETLAAITAAASKFLMAYLSLYVENDQFKVSGGPSFRWPSGEATEASRLDLVVRKILVPIVANVGRDGPAPSHALRGDASTGVASADVAAARRKRSRAPLLPCFFFGHHSDHRVET